MRLSMVSSIVTISASLNGFGWLGTASNKTRDVIIGASLDVAQRQHRRESRGPHRGPDTRQGADGSKDNGHSENHRQADGKAHGVGEIDVAKRGGFNGKVQRIEQSADRRAEARAGSRSETSQKHP